MRRSKEGANRVNTSRKTRRQALAVLLAAVALISSGCSWADLPRYGWPESATKQGERLQFLWSATFTAALVVGVVVWGLMFWCFIAYRKRKNSPLYPKQTRENLPIEMVYTAIPFVLITALFYFGTSAEQYALKLVDEPDVTVEVTARQWGWDFAYAVHGDNDIYNVPNERYADRDLLTADDGSIVLTRTDEKNSGPIPVLMLPNNATVQYELESIDVVHAFWVPAYDFKLDVFPYPKQNNTENRFQTTLQREGAWVGRCAELCGTYHAAMNFEVRSVPRDVFDAYIAKRQEINPASGEAYTTSQALEALQEQFPDCGELCEPYAVTTYPLETNRTMKAAPVAPDYVRGLK